MTRSSERAARGASFLNRAREVMPDALRAPPQSIEAEQAVLGALLLHNAAWDWIQGIVTETAFYRDSHRIIFRHIGHLIENNKSADCITVRAALGPGELERIGGVEYLTELALGDYTMAGVRNYAETVAKCFKLRQALALAMEVLDRAYEPGVDPDDVLDAAEAGLYDLREHAASRDEMRPLDDVICESIEHIDRMYQMEGPKLAGVSTGLVDLDRLTGGLEAGDLLVVGARPSMGKTTIGLGFGQHVAERTKGAVAVFSMEMSGLQLGLRYISANADISMHGLRTGDVAEEDWKGIVKAASRLRDLPVYIDDRAAVSVGYVRARCRRLARRTGKLSLVIVDYLTLMSGEGESRDERVGVIAKGLKQLAKDLQVPVVVLAQLNRSCEQRTDKRPMLSDLRESGEIEQAADVIMFIYRDEVYDKNTENKGVAEIIVAKQRNGPTDTVYTTFLGKSMRFVNIDPTWQPSSPAPKTRAPVRNLSDFKSRAAGEEASA